MFSAHLEKLAPAENSRMRGLPRVLDDALEVRSQGVLALQQLLQLLLVLHHHDVGPAVGRPVLELRHAGGGVDTDCESSSHH